MALAAIEGGDGGGFAEHCDAAGQDCRLEEAAKAGGEIGSGAVAENYCCDKESRKREGCRDQVPVGV